jgi:dihydrofolate synthase/folylpolyglutamate synthase
LRFLNYFQLTDYLNELGMFHMDLTLDRVRKFVALWGGAGSFKTIHVVGTNGKGSTSSYLSSISIAHGYKTGLYTSPHFISPRERIKIQGEMLSEDDWVCAANLVDEIAPDCGLTYFEFLTCMAFVLFQKKGVDVAVMEAGLGGLYDATNVINPDITVFTPIGMDHENVLGKTLTAIATDKAGAMRSGGMCITAFQENEAQCVLDKTAHDIGAELKFPDDRDYPEGAHPKLMGAHQRSNAGLACSSWKYFCEKFNWDLNKDKVRAGLEEAFIPGRFQKIVMNSGMEMFLDGAHNIHAFRALESVIKSFDIVPDHIIFGCMKDKDLTEIKPILKSLTKGLIICTGIPDNLRAFPADKLAAELGGNAVSAKNIKVALELLPSNSKRVLVCGSLFLLSGFYTIYPIHLNG